MFKLKKIRDSKHNNIDFIYKNDNIILYKIMLNKDNLFDFENWNKNRPPDPVRVEQIKEYFKLNNVNMIPGIIYGWKNPNNDKIMIYDGIHRLLAGKELEKPMLCLIQLTTTENEQDIINDFTNINKSVSVPSIYLEETDVLKKLVCQSVSDAFCRKYPAFVSPSRKPYIYNFNRDNLVEFISTLEINFTKPGIDKQIVNEMVGMNFLAKEYVSRNKIEHPKKCQFHNFYLFFLDKSFIKHRLEELLV